MERRLAAILAAAVVGYSRLMGADEAGTLAEIKNVQSNIDTKVCQHHGRIFKLTGDGVMAEFPSVVSAVACAAEIQRDIRGQCAKLPIDRRTEFRIGVNFGNILVDGHDVYGDGVNVAARLEAIAQPGGITISQSVRDHVGHRLELAFEDGGEQNLKNIDRPVRVYRVVLEEAIGEMA